MATATEVWAKGKRWRAVTVAAGRTVAHKSVRLSRGGGYEDFEYYVKNWGLEQAARTSFVTGGTEKWKWDLTIMAAKEVIDRFMASATKDGFKSLGIYKDR